MPPHSTSASGVGDAPSRERGDACPGALRLHRADDGFLARLRLPGGLLTSRQAETLATAAERLADGHLSITSRGNVELRGLGESCGGELAARLDEAGLLPSQQHERVRNIVASPAAGLDGSGCAQVQLWVRELDALLCAEDWTAALSGRFLFALDDGRGDVAGLGGDVTLIAAPDGEAVVRVASSAYRLAGADAPRAALAAARAFLAAAGQAANGAWRVRDLPDGCEVQLAAFLRESGITVRAVAGTGLRTSPGPGALESAGAAPPSPGILRAPDGSRTVVTAAPLGRLGTAQWRALLPAPGDELRLTPWRTVLVPGFTADAAVARLDLLAAAGLATGPDFPWLHVGACTGRPGCAKSRADVRADALPAPGTGLPVYWSGCERRCGHPQGDWVDVLAAPDGDDAQTGAYSVTVHRRGADDLHCEVPRTTSGLQEAVASARTGRSPRITTPPGASR